MVGEVTTRKERGHLERPELGEHVVEREPDGDDVRWHKVKVSRVAMERERRGTRRLSPHLHSVGVAAAHQ